jgi:hypothetical protein
VLLDHWTTSAGSHLAHTTVTSAPSCASASPSERTARTHVSNILAKLHLECRTQAVLLAIQHGLAPYRRSESTRADAANWRRLTTGHALPSCTAGRV